MVKNLPPRLRELLKARGGPVGASFLAGPSNKALSKTVTAIAAGSEADTRSEGKSNLWRSRTEDGSRFRQIPNDARKPLLEKWS